MELEILETHGDEDLAKVYLASAGTNGSGKARLLEFVESLQPPHPREDKWVLILSSLYGCPVDCPMCDAGGDYHGKPSKEELLAQADALVLSRYADGKVPAGKFKIQFARMGDPAFNPAVLDVLRELPARYDAPGLMPCISTVAPSSAPAFLEELRAVKDELYSGGHFQLQFSIHTTDEGRRDELIPVKKLSMEDVAEYGRSWFREGDRKISLNFAAMVGYPIDVTEVARIFDADRFLIKLTPMNPTANAEGHGLRSVIDGHHPESASELVSAFESAGFTTILSIGEMEENRIGSNCGQYVRAMRH